MRVEFTCANNSTSLTVKGSEELSIYTSVVSYLLVLVNGAAPDSDDFFACFKKIAIMDETQSVQTLLQLAERKSESVLKSCSFAIEANMIDKGCVDIIYIPVKNYPGNLELMICALSFLKMINKKTNIDLESLLEKVYDSYNKLLPLYLNQFERMIDQLQKAA